MRITVLEDSFVIGGIVGFGLLGVYFVLFLD